MGPGNQQETDENSMSQPEQFGDKKARKIMHLQYRVRYQGARGGHQFSFSTTKTPAQGKTIYRQHNFLHLLLSDICLYGDGSLV